MLLIFLIGFGVKITDFLSRIVAKNEQNFQENKFKINLKDRDIVEIRAGILLEI